MVQYSQHITARWVLLIAVLSATPLVPAGWLGDPPLVNQYGEEEFLAACRENNLGAVRYYLGLEGFDYNGHYRSGGSGDDVTGLYLASTLGHDQIVKALVEAGADTGRYCTNQTPLFTACVNNHKEVVRHLLEADTNVNQLCQGVAPLHIACEEGFADIVAMLIAAGAEVDSVCEHPHGFTSLYIACQNGHDAVVELLVAKGADVNKSGLTVSPLHVASYFGKDKVASILLAKGADVHQLCDGVPPLYFACYCGHSKVVEVLLAAGANPSEQWHYSCCSRTSPIGIARGNRPCLRILNRDKYDRYTQVISQLNEAQTRRQVQEYLLQPLHSQPPASASARVGRRPSRESVTTPPLTPATTGK